MHYNHDFKKLNNPFFGLTYDDFKILVRKCEGYVIPPKYEDIYFCYFNGTWKIGHMFVMWYNQIDDSIMEVSTEFNLETQPKWEAKVADLVSIKTQLKNCLHYPTTVLDDNYDKFTEYAREDHPANDYFYSFLGAKNDVLRAFRRLVFSLCAEHNSSNKDKKLYMLSDKRDGEKVTEFVRELSEDAYIDDNEQLHYLFWLSEDEVKAAKKQKIVVELARGDE